MELYKDESLCCGCSACASICPKGAISIIPDKKGFLIPEINNALCVDCGLCVKICPLQNQTKENYKEQTGVFAAMHKEGKVREKSRSGGVFMAVAEWIINHGGAVYGAAFDDDLSVCHMRAETFEECSKFQGSKYVQSDVKNTFKEAEADLKNGKFVLYSGTGCQVDGLLRYLKTKRVNTEKLVTCDIICHGNVSPKMYEDYRNWCEKKYRGKIKSFNFRDKAIGWAPHVESFIINGKKHMKYGYTELYYCKASYRESCYVCPYAEERRVGDFTLADCWGAQQKLPEMFDNRGISLLLVGSEKAQMIIDSVKESLHIKAVSLNDFMQPQLRHPIEKSVRCKEFWSVYEKEGFGQIIKSFGKQNPKENLKRWIKWHIIHRY